MAKSIRSKWKRKCRAVKRERYGKKELDRLKKTLGIDEKNGDVDTAEISTIATVTDAKAIKQNQESQETEAEEVMAVDTTGKRVFNAKTMRDQNGTYPAWMNQRKIRGHRTLQRKKKKNNMKNKK